MALQRYLAIETSSPRLSLAVGDELKVLKTLTGKHDWRHAESLFDGIHTLLRQVKWPIQSLTGVAVSIGPGSFTGIRIGLAAARALGQSLKIPVIGVSSLEVIAMGAHTKFSWLAPQIDALQQNVYGALYKRNGSGRLHKVLAETMIPAKAWKARAHKLAQRNKIWFSPYKESCPEAGVLLEISREDLSRAGPRSFEEVLPLYVRQPAVIERLK